MRRERESEKAGDISFALGWPREYCHCMSAGGSHFFPSSSALYRVELVLHATFTHHICVARVSQSAQYLAAAFVCMRGCALSLSLYPSLIHCRFCRLFHATLWKAKIWRRRCPVSSLSSCSMCSSSSSPSSAFHCSPLLKLLLQELQRYLTPSKRLCIDSNRFSILSQSQFQ